MPVIEMENGGAGLVVEIQFPASRIGGELYPVIGIRSGTELVRNRLQVIKPDDAARFEYNGRRYTITVTSEPSGE